jgi:hypothetical protein
MRTPETFSESPVQTKNTDGGMSRREMITKMAAAFGAALLPAIADAQDWTMSRYGKTHTSARAPAPKPESLGRRSLNMLDRTDERLREMFESLQNHNDVSRIKAMMEAEFNWLDKQELDLSEYLQRDIDVMSSRSFQPIQSVMLDSLCLLQRVVGATPALRKEYPAYALREGNTNWTVSPVGLLNNRRNMSFAVTQRDTKTGTEKMTSVSSFELASAIVRRDCGRILHTAEDAWSREQKGRNNLRAFDVPKNEPIVVLQIIAADGDPVMGASLMHTYLFSRLLKKRNPKTEHRIVLTRIPQLDVKLALAAIKDKAKSRKEKPPYCIQDYNCHGSETALQFRQPLTPQQIRTMQEGYGGQGHVQSIACYGGGLRVPDTLAPQTSFTHTDGRSWTCLAMRRGLESDMLSTDGRGSPFMLFLLRELSQNLKSTFGEAVALADEHTKRIARLNPGATINGVQTE